MMKLLIKDLCQLRNIAQPLPTLAKAGISRTVAHDYLTGKRSFIMLKHVEILCRLFNCTPNDLFVWEPDSPAEDVPGNPLQKLKKRELPDTLKIIHSKTVEEIIAWTEQQQKE